MATKKKPTPKKKPARAAAKADPVSPQETPRVRALSLLFATLCLAFLVMAYWRYAA